MAHEVGFRDRHPLARLQRYYHSHETLEKNSTRRANQTPRANLDRRRSRHDPQAQTFRPSVYDGPGDCCLGTAGAGYNPIRGCVHLVAVIRKNNASGSHELT
ncbi:hypothetical protein PCH_Pc24g00910 [Penicillium rubens Wisconsin 54-1255]|uniref:Uncharacterized protein n=1 Tax=Penicillium rubens (strain ATCC 28089 / DSM 1075 / NRRL 1951 / Wisconsin 54-1255) TaxID=500485 RepID=B6HWP9_PENRW|nr:hypothetical protein PCH_Pc24g00910 [Penicillium rubens Wisconsin 54-1255]